MPFVGLFMGMHSVQGLSALEQAEGCLTLPYSRLVCLLEQAEFSHTCLLSACLCTLGPGTLAQWEAAAMWARTMASSMILMAVQRTLCTR